LKQVAEPDEVVVHAVESCAGCGESLVGTPGEVECRQVFEMPPSRLRVTEHRAERKRCACCGTVTVGEFPAEAVTVAQYGPGIRSLATYLMVGHALPVKRTQEILRDLFGHTISTGTLCAMVKQGAENLVGWEAAVKELLIAAPVVHADESGARVGGKLWWLHVASTPDLTCYAIHQKRGGAAMDEIGILPKMSGTLVTDCWKPYLSYADRHGLCDAHVLRELVSVSENHRQTWADDLMEALLDAKDQVDAAREAGATELPRHRRDLIDARFHAIVQQGLDLPENVPTGRKQTVPKNLLDRLRLYQSYFLAFVHDFTVPFDNNLAERDIRMVKVKQKVSGGFRSEDGAKWFARIRGYISTARKQGQDIFSALTAAFSNQPFALIPTG
jgi:transposase